MSAPIQTAAPLQWPADVREFAVKHEIHAYLAPLLNALYQVFPTATSISVTLEEDPEIRDDWHIIFYVKVPIEDVPNYVEARHRWNDESFRICPATLICYFRLCLIPVAT